LPKIVPSARVTRAMIPTGLPFFDGLACTVTVSPGSRIVGLQPARPSTPGARPSTVHSLFRAVFAFDGDKKPRARIGPTPLLDGAGQCDDLVDLVCRIAVVSERRKRGNRSAASAASVVIRVCMPWTSLWIDEAGAAPGAFSRHLYIAGAAISMDYVEARVAAALFSACARGISAKYAEIKLPILRANGRSVRDAPSPHIASFRPAPRPRTDSTSRARPPIRPRRAAASCARHR